MTRLFLFFLFAWALDSNAVSIIVDPGHGGEDLGAISKFKSKNKKTIKEKDLTLQISKYLYDYLKKYDYSVYLTRSIDKNLTLENRASLAEKVKADLFISLHINASSNSRSKGFEIFYLDNHDDKAVKKVETVENSGGGEPSIVNQIIADLVVERTVPKSKSLALSIHKEVGRNFLNSYGILDRGIKPGLFYVLALTKRPAVLIEVGFLSNKREVRKLTSKDFQRNFAKAVAKGVARYIKQAGLQPDPPLF